MDINNTLSRNGQHIRIYEHDRLGRDDPLITWNVRDIVVVNNILSGTRDPTAALLSVFDQRRTRTAEQMGVVVDHNAYFRSRAGAPAALVQWAAGRRGARTFRTLGEYRRRTGQEQHGLELAQPHSNPFFSRSRSVRPRRCRPGRRSHWC